MYGDARRNELGLEDQKYASHIVLLYLIATRLTCLSPSKSSRLYKTILQQTSNKHRNYDELVSDKYKPREGNLFIEPHLKDQRGQAFAYAGVFGAEEAVPNIDGLSGINVIYGRY